MSLSFRPFVEARCAHYQSLHEFTLTDFSKRKQFDNEYRNSPFYTHQGGYKFSIVIYANGFRRGKNTHIAVFIHQVAGEYDDQLKWPFVGNFDLELLNWRENKRHHKVSLSIGAEHEFGKVVEGGFGASLGFPSFISHSSLVYDSLQNTEYLQEDCLRLRVNLSP